MAVSWAWSGGVTDTSAVVVAKVASSASVRVAYSTASDLSSPTYTTAVTADANGYARATLTGLTANTVYHYGIEEAGVLDAWRGKFRSFPTPGAVASFSIAHGSCMNSTGTQADHPIFTKIKDHDPLLFCHLGDFHYSDITTNDAALYRAAYEYQIGQAAFGGLVGNVPIDYLWDDHDYGDDDSDNTSPSKAAAASTYRQVVPHYTLSDSGAIYHSFQIGRVWVIATDLRYYRSPSLDTDTSSKSMLGATQKAWLKAQFDAARDNGAKLVVWMNTQVWRTTPPFTGISADGEHWGNFSYERAELADYIRDNGIPRVVIISGDMHSLAYDDGSNSDFATGGGAPIAVFQAAPLSHAATHTRGVNWSGGTPIENPAQFGLLSIDDNGSEVSVSWAGYSVTSGGVESEVLTYPTPMTARAVKYWDGAAWVDGQVHQWDGAAFEERAAYTR